MNMRRVGSGVPSVVAVFLVLFMPATLTSGQQSDVPESIVLQITDSIRFKLLYMDSVENLLGVGWQDREGAGVGLKAIRTARDRIASKYGFRLPTREADFDFDLPKPLELSGAGYNVSIAFPDGWFEVYHFKNWGKLPVVKYRSGGVSLNLKTMELTFRENTRVMVADREYVSTAGKFAVRGKP